MAWYWAGWLLIGFLVPETIALATGHADWTLSETAWKWFDVMPGQTWRHWTIVHGLFVVFMSWLWVHLCLRAFTVWRLHR